MSVTTPRPAWRPLVLIVFLAFLGQSSLLAQDLDRFRTRESPKFSFDFPRREAGGEISIHAARQSGEPNVFVVLEGDVKIVYQDVTVTGDTITYNFVTQDLTADGNVIVDQGPQRMSAERVVFNLGTKTGTLFRATGSFDGSVFFAGAMIEKIDDVTYRLTDGIFTSCDLDNPSWSFHLQSGTITVDDYARLRNLSFRAGRIPVLWTPYLVWPTQRERSRGFLVPRIGASNRFGAYLGNAYFIPFGDSADATIYADYYSKGYYGGGTELRYVPTEDIKGGMEAYAVRDPENNTVEWRYDVQHTHDNLPGGFRGVVDLQDFSNLEFFRLFSRDFNLNTLSNIYSSAHVTRNTSTYAFNVRMDRREHIGDTTSLVFEQLPAVEFRTYPNRIGTSPLYVSLESSASHLRTSLGANYYRTDVFPTLSLQLRTPQWLSVKPQISLRETYYSSSLDPLSGRPVDDALSRSYAQAQVEVVGPSFSRIFRQELAGFNRFKHVIEPRFRYLYTDGVDPDEQRRVIRFDTIDAPFLPIVRDTVEYSLTQRLLAREAVEGASAREIVTLAFRQAVSIGTPFDQSGLPSPNRRFTPINANLQVRPWQSVSLDANAAIDHETRQFSNANISTNLLGPQASFLSFTWFASFQPPGVALPGTSQFRITGGGPIWRDRIRGAAQINYDAERGEFLEQRFVLDTRASCYSIALEYRDFQIFRDGALRKTRDYHISVSLKNVGTFVDLRGSLERRN